MDSFTYSLEQIVQIPLNTFAPSLPLEFFTKPYNSLLSATFLLTQQEGWFPKMTDGSQTWRVGNFHMPLRSLALLATISFSLFPFGSSEKSTNGLSYHPFPAKAPLPPRPWVGFVSDQNVRLRPKQTPSYALHVILHETRLWC